MVRAVLAGVKTQTRRIVKPQPERVEKYEPHDPQLFADGMWRWHTGVVVRDGTAVRCPYGEPGDTLWCRESFKQRGHWGHMASDESGEAGDPVWLGADPRRGGGPFHECIHFMADGDVGDPSQWRGMPSIFLPRWASRLTLAVESVRVERVQAISDADIAAEGVTVAAVRALWSAAGKKDRGEAVRALAAAGQHAPIVAAGLTLCAPIALWQLAWTFINGAASWDANPWCWVIGFRQVEQESRAA